MYLRKKTFVFTYFTCFFFTFTALNFFEKFSVDQEEYYAEDLKQLSTVTLSEQMEGNQLLDNFKWAKQEFIYKVLF